MNKDYKAKLLEKAGIYIDCCQLLKCVSMLKFGRRYIKNKSFNNTMRKIDELSVNTNGAKRILCSMNSHLGMLKNIEQKRRMSEFVNKALCKFGNILCWNLVNKSFSIRV